ARLEYPSVGPERARLAGARRVTYEAVTGAEALRALETLCRTQAIIPALKPAPALAAAMRLSAQRGRGGEKRVAPLRLSGRGDQGVGTAAEWCALQAPEEDSQAPSTGLQA